MNVDPNKCRMNVLLHLTGKKRKKKLRQFNRQVRRNNCVNVNKIPIARMEDLIVNAKEYKVLKKNREYLEKRFNVEILMPPKARLLESDVAFVSVKGEPLNRSYIKLFMAEETKKEDSSTNENIITLSDSESDSESEASIIELDSEETTKPDVKMAHDDSVCLDQSRGVKRKVKNMKVRSEEISLFEDSDACEVTSTTDDKVAKKAKLSESVLIIKEEPGTSTAVDFIPLFSENKSMKQKKEHTNENLCSKSKNSNEINKDDSIMIIEDDKPPVPPRRLRPIVIDGSNVAMEHGKSSRTFSVKGLKVAIDYFLERGHKEVTAFVPKFRKSSNPNRTVVTTDADLFEELEKTQHVVFTPSRRVNGKCINPYDDRFIVQLAASNGGVIVSNDNFRDLVEENETYKETVEKRLLMFLFVGDMFMVPDDPLGRDGPKLDEFLSFPAEDQEEKTTEEDKEINIQEEQ